MKTTIGANKERPVVFANDLDEYDPYRNGDYTLLACVASWLLLTYSMARQEWAVGRQEGTEDGLMLALDRMRLTDVQLAQFKRLLNLAGRAIEDEQGHHAQLREIAAQVG